MQTRAEEFAMSHLSEIYLRLHRLSYCWADLWWPQTQAPSATAASATDVKSPAVVVAPASYEAVLALETADSVRKLDSAPPNPLSAVPLPLTAARLHAPAAAADEPPATTVAGKPSGLFGGLKNKLRSKL